MSTDPLRSVRSLRILRVIHTLRRESGGPAESVRRSTAALLDLGHHVEVVTQDPPGTSPPPGAGFTFHPVGGGDYATLGAWICLRHAEFDAVLVQGLWQTGATVHRALRGTQTPYLVFPHGMLDRTFRRAYPLKHVKKQIYWWFREGRVLRDAAAVCFTCEEECRVARGTFWPYQVRERVVAYGTARPPAEAAAQRARFLAAYPVLAEAPFLLFLSRIHSKKGVKELIAAHAAFTREHPDAPRLVIAGPCADADEAAALRRGAREAGHPQADFANPDGRLPDAATCQAARLVWLPMLDDNLKWGAILAAEAFVLLSHQENFGIAVAEALACGRPVLISDKVNIWREVTAAGAGLARPDTVAGGIELLRAWSALGAPARTEMGRAAQACFEARFEITHAAQDLAAAISEAIGEARPRVLSTP